MSIKKWTEYTQQMCRLGTQSWSVARLVHLSRELPVLEIPLEQLYVYYVYDKVSLRDFVMHMNAVNAADLSKPIILDDDGVLMDGRHRIMKAMLLGEKTIKAVRFEENPTPCSVSD